MNRIKQFVFGSILILVLIISSSNISLNQILAYADGAMALPTVVPCSVTNTCNHTQSPTPQPKTFCDLNPSDARCGMNLPTATSPYHNYYTGPSHPISNSACVGPIVSVSTPSATNNRIWIDNMGPWKNWVSNWHVTTGSHYVTIDRYSYQTGQFIDRHVRSSYVDNCHPFTIKWG